MWSKVLVFLVLIFLSQFISAPSIEGDLVSLFIETDKETYLIGDDINIKIFAEPIAGVTTPLKIDYRVIISLELYPYLIQFDQSYTEPNASGSGKIEINDIPILGSETLTWEPGVYRIRLIAISAVNNTTGEEDEFIGDNVAQVIVNITSSASGAPPTSVPELPVVFVIFIVLAVLFIVRKN